MMNLVEAGRRGKKSDRCFKGSSQVTKNQAEAIAMRKSPLLALGIMPYDLVSAAYEKDGKRAILDGGFTRLYCKWETAGTDRFVVNAASWLVNVDNFELSEVGDDGESPEARLRFPLTEVAMLSVEAGIVASLALVRG